MESSFDAISGYVERAQARREEISAMVEQLNMARAASSPGRIPQQSGGSKGRGNPGGGGGRGGSGRAVMPIKGAGFTAGSAGDFGGRINPVSGEHSEHTGYDFSAAAGTRIRATTGGKVVSVEWDPIYGWETIIKTKNGFTNQYAHQLRKPKFVSVGDKVRAGEVIGRVGSTGWSTGPHLHYGVQNRRGAWINPVKYLDKLLGRK